MTVGFTRHIITNMRFYGRESSFRFSDKLSHIIRELLPPMPLLPPLTSLNKMDEVSYKCEAFARTVTRFAAITDHP